MSNPTRSQQRFRFRNLIRIRSNYPTLPPITATTGSTEQENEPVQSSLNVAEIDVKCETRQSMPKIFGFDYMKILPRKD